MLSSAQDYRAIWEQFVLRGRLQDDLLPPALAQAWRRCAALGLDPYSQPPDPDPPGFSATQPLSRRLLALIRPAMEDLYQFIEGSDCLVAFANAEGRIIDLIGDRETRSRLEPLGMRVGALWTEELQGANALALALQESFPMQLEGAMHYRAALHNLYTAAAPVHDPLGQAVGVLAVVGPRDQAHVHTLGMVAAAAQVISGQLQMQVWLGNANELLAELKIILQSLPEGILLLRRDGVISQMNGPAGALLGLVPARVMGRRLRDVLPLPSLLQQALTCQQPLNEEELVFETTRGRVTCLCSLKPIALTASAAGEPEPIFGRLTAGAGTISGGPLISDGFVLILRSIERVQKLVNRMTGTRARLTFANVVGNSAPLQEALRLARLASHSNSTVLLHGETGVGKEIFAQSIHNNSPRADGPFVAINCAAIPRELINTELFGYEGGSFTGADRQGRSGKFEQAHGGTLFLDEIGDMPLDLQTTLLRAIETRTIMRIGGQRLIPVDVRIIAATHKDLREEVRRGTFRSDLFYRLNVLSIHIPPLRARLEDLPLLVEHFLQRQSQTLGRSFRITPEALSLMERYSWPGNVRELANLLERLTYLARSDTITIQDLPPEIRQPAESDTTNATLAPSSATSLPKPQNQAADAIWQAEPSLSTPTLHPLKERSRSTEASAILQALEHCQGRPSAAARLLGISRTTLWRKMVRYGLRPAPVTSVSSTVDQGEVFPP
ncbi:sigma-54-dependent Fis family transcriptional regulator [Thermogemmatispora sp.]|uniref:sigma-54-dependent Fis family transcriptional regulator n=1 Tax=Thermogemmatispora sp. TaxID=1968838 RepID=UPI001DD57B3D|nr:sigma 54-interacting transcriptional regulator [Thermogemmatispora sp.]MBX5448945.1 sigma 54-interacting transcriptional regulator [Thermogemmatispora sp.]